MAATTSLPLNLPCAPRLLPDENAVALGAVGFAVLGIDEVGDEGVDGRRLGFEHLNAVFPAGIDHDDIGALAGVVTETNVVEDIPLGAEAEDELSAAHDEGARSEVRAEGLDGRVVGGA